MLVFIISSCSSDQYELRIHLLGLGLRLGGEKCDGTSVTLLPG